ncbi:MAG: hypothetical protein ACK5PQ_04940 [Alphaproteobacteria bacterium]
MIHLKKVFLLTLCSFISAFGASSAGDDIHEDPVRAMISSKVFSTRHPNLPLKNVGTIYVTDPLCD